MPTKQSQRKNTAAMLLAKPMSTCPYSWQIKVAEGFSICLLTAPNQHLFSFCGFRIANCDPLAGFMGYALTVNFSFLLPVRISELIWTDKALTTDSLGALENQKFAILYADRGAAAVVSWGLAMRRLEASSEVVWLPAGSC